MQQLVNSALRSLNGYVRHTRKQKQGQVEFGSRMVREDEGAYRIDLEDEAQA